MLKNLGKLKLGTKITIKIETPLGTDTICRVRYFGEIEDDGYIHESGAWSLYEIPGTVEKCYSCIVRPYRKRKLYRMKIGFEIKSFEIGWLAFYEDIWQYK